MSIFFGLFILALVTYYVYRTTRDRGRSPVLWASLTFVLGIAMQFILPVLATAVIVYIKMGPSASSRSSVRQMEEVQAYGALFSVGGVLLSVIGAGAILFFVARGPQKDPAGSAPPPPPPFIGENVDQE